MPVAIVVALPEPGPRLVAGLPFDEVLVSVPNAAGLAGALAPGDA
ncbi:hypothetical protein P3102_20515 [Amycolatopsis sp. QT-25]|nr:hypothetical protein [Amycolatopsis sp. QT-25]WET76512.1 hypothetical protein P3102_20515 [Amycolatopsis sp. QT-25]